MVISAVALAAPPGNRALSSTTPAREIKCCVDYSFRLFLFSHFYLLAVIKHRKPTATVNATTSGDAAATAGDAAATPAAAQAQPVQSTEEQDDTTSIDTMLLAPVDDTSTACEELETPAGGSEACTVAENDADAGTCASASDGMTERRRPSMVRAFDVTFLGRCLVF